VPLSLPRDDLPNRTLIHVYKSIFSRPAPLSLTQRRLAQ
jgi:hypothetical protein